MLQADVWHFLGVRQLRAPSSGQAPKLVTTGLYGWVRHPLYTAGLLLLWLTPLLTANLLALNLGLTVYILVGSQFEERRLLEEFGQAYLLYRTSVPALLPRPWGTPMSLRAARRGASFAPLSG